MVLRAGRALPAIVFLVGQCPPYIQAYHGATSFRLRIT
jgi:hypothetical protein